MKGSILKAAQLLSSYAEYYLPKEMNDRRPSIGTIIEIGWSIGLKKPLIVVSDDKQIMEHPLIKCNAAWRLKELDEAVEVIIGLFGDYVS